MTADEVMPYLGLPYSDTGSGPDAYNCWGLLRHIQQAHFGRELPEFPIGDSVATKEAHETSLARGSYRLVSEPVHGDAVLLRGGESPHVGVWLDIDGGGVLHSMGGHGVIWTPRGRLNMLGFGRSTYYRIRNVRPACSPEGSIPPSR